MRKLYVIAVMAGMAFGAQAMAQEPAPVVAAPETKATSLDQLLRQVQQGRVLQSEENRRREAEFISQRDRQRELLRQAEAAREAEQRRSDRLERQYQNNETEIAQIEQTLTERMGILGELFGVMRQVAGDTRGIVTGSIISAQYGGRDKFLDALAQKKSLPSIEEIEQLWYEMQREMTESGRIVRFSTNVIAAKDGVEVQKEVVRIGAFNAIADGQYLEFKPSVQKLAELIRQPAGRYLNTAEELQNSSGGGMIDFGLDPSRGSILSLLVQSPSWTERVDQGGIIGYIILVLGALGLLLVVERAVYLSVQGRKVKAQQQATDTVLDPESPLGRIIQIYHSNKQVDVETLELKLDEAILQATPKLERGLTTLKIVAAIAPLLGLLGTVTGMIQTFQAITLFGTGDPKLMAGGISQALVTTMLGLIVAIPMTLLHSWVAGMSKGITQVLEEQSAGYIAVHAEQEGR